MIISRGYAGIILMAVVFSTILMFFIIGETPDRPVEILRNDAPPLNSGSDQKFGYAYSIVFRDNFDEVKVKFAWLRGATMVVDDTAAGDGIQDVLPSVVKLGVIDEILAPHDYEPEVIDSRLWPEGWPDGDQILLLDYSDALRTGMDDQSELVHSIFMFVEKNGSVVSYYEGIPDYFPEREWRFPNSMKPSPTRIPRGSGSMELGLDESRTKYVSPGEKALYPELPSLVELPPYGELVFNDVRKDQRLTVLTFIHGRSLGYGWQKELIRVYVDGELVHIQVN